MFSKKDKDKMSNTEHTASASAAAQSKHAKPANAVAASNAAATKSASAGPKSASANQASVASAPANKHKKAAASGKPQAGNKAPAYTLAHDKAFKNHQGLSKLIWSACIIIALVGGVFAGRSILSGPFGTSTISNKGNLQDADLKSAIAYYEDNGQRVEVTAQEVIEQKQTLDKAKQDDGTYKLPTSDDVLNYIRTQILAKEAQKQGIDATDEEVTDYIHKNLNEDSVESLANKYHMENDKVKEVLHTSTIIQKLRDKNVTSGQTKLPVPPKAPEQGKEDELNVDYAKYIIALAGDEWDSDNDTWKSQDGPYATALKGMEISSAKGANFKAVQAAYRVAMQHQEKQKRDDAEKWRTYANSLFTKVKVGFYTLSV